jgi:hypothetical protein
MSTQWKVRWRMGRIPDSYIAAAISILMAAIFVVSHARVSPFEDAIILFDYAKNLATEGVITYGSGSSVPIEGATDFLYMIAIAVMARLGIDEFAAALILNYLGLLLICYLLRLSRLPFWVIVVAILGTPYLYASLLGFSAIAFSALYVLCLYLLPRHDSRLYVAILALCLLRPDGIVWVVGLITIRFLGIDKTTWNVEVIKVTTCFLIPGCAYFLWRLWYFKEWLPLPFLVKASGERSLSDALGAILPVAIPVVVAVVISDNIVALAKRMLLLLSLPVLFYSSMRLEQNWGDRFIAPLFFGALFLVREERPDFLAATFVMLSLYFSWDTTYGMFQALLNYKMGSMYGVASKITQLNPGRLLTTEAGVLAYYSNWHVEDSWGLNTPRFAHSVINDDTMKDGDYDLIAAHCDLSMLTDKPSIGVDLSPQRSWDGQCRVLAGYILRSKYDVFLVPMGSFYDFDTRSVRELSWLESHGIRLVCKSQIIFAVSPVYPQAEQLKAILLQEGGVPLDTLHRGYAGDSTCSANLPEALQR